MSVLGGLGLYILEAQHGNPISFIDALYTAASCLCVCGLMCVDVSQFSTGSHVLLLVLILMGGISVSTLPLLMLRIVKAKKDEILLEQ